MARKIDDRALWIGLGVFAFAAVKTVSYALKETLRLTEIHEELPKNPVCEVNQDTEDSIPAESLASLAKSHNWDIREAAIKILCNRFLSQPSNVQELDCESCSTNEDTAHRALLVYRLLKRHNPHHDALHILNSALTGESESARAEQNGYLLPRLREREDSPEEQALRRRRREAIVVNEGDRPVTQDDIIQRLDPFFAVRPRDEVETRRVERALEDISTSGDVA